MDHASDAVTPPDPELIQAGDATRQRAQRRGLVQGAVRPKPAEDSTPPSLRRPEVASGESITRAISSSTCDGKASNNRSP